MDKLKFIDDLTVVTPKSKIIEELLIELGYTCIQQVGNDKVYAWVKKDDDDDGNLC